MRVSIVAFALGVLAARVCAETPTAELATPPAAAQHFTIMSSAGKHGTSARWATADGTRMGRESLVLRGQVFELDSAANLGGNGLFERVVVRGHTPNGDAGEVFAIDDGIASWKSPVDAGSSPYRSAAEYTCFGGPIDVSAQLFEALLAAPDNAFALLPGGRARAEKLTTATVGEGSNTKNLVAYAITGITNTPMPMWADESGKFFAFIGGLVIRPGRLRELTARSAEGSGRGAQSAIA